MLAKSRGGCCGETWCPWNDIIPACIERRRRMASKRTYDSCTVIATAVICYSRMVSAAIDCE